MIKIPDLSKISKREKLMIAFGAIVLFVMVSDRLVLGPWLEYSSAMDKEIAELEQTYKGRRKLVSRKPYVMQDVEAYKHFMNTGRSPEVEMASFLTEIENLGRRSGISLQEVSPLSSIEDEHTVSYGLEIHYEATMKEWIKFVYLIESSPSLFVVEKAVLGKQDEDADILRGFFQIRKPVLKESL